MKPLPANSSDEVLIAYVDRWASLLEKEEYAAAFAAPDSEGEMRWTADLVREVIKAYDDAIPTQRVTLEGQSTDISQRKKVSRWSKNRRDHIGEIWYDLNIDGLASDLIATFWIVAVRDGLVLRLNDIHVM